MEEKLKRKIIMSIIVAVVVVMAVCLVGCGGKKAPTTTGITGAGSSFIYPLFSQWAADYNKAENIQINYQSIGSSGGIAQLQSKTVIFACSDQPQSMEILTKNSWIQFPAAIGGIVPITNIQGVTGSIALSGPVLANIYLGIVKYWDDSSIKALNPGVNLPHAQIIVVRRSDGSGTTFNFTSYLSAVSGAWKSQVGANTTVQWPGTTIGAQGNSGVASQVKTLPNSIGYVEYAYAVQNSLQMCPMQNGAGKMVSPNLTSFEAAAASAKYSIDNGFNTLLANMPGAGSWPIMATTFAVMPKSVLSTSDGTTVKNFFTWAFSTGQQTAQNLSYVPLPESLVKSIQAQLQ